MSDYKEEITFTVAPGFSMPSGIKPGDEFHAVATLKLEDDGTTLCLKDIEGYPVTEVEKKENDEGSQQQPGGFLDAVEAGINNNAGTQYS